MMTSTHPIRLISRRAAVAGYIAVVAGLLLVGGCQSPQDYRQEADQVAADILTAGQTQALGRTEPFTIEKPADTLRRRLLGEQHLATTGPASFGSDQLNRPEHWPEDDYPQSAPGDAPVVEPRGDAPITLTLIEALQVAARNSRNYQRQKETVFITALNLDEALDEFRNTYAGAIATLLEDDRSTGDDEVGLDLEGDFSLSRRLESGAVITTSIALDLTRLLTSPRTSALGIAADVSIVIPLLRGSGRHIVTEALTQAERNVIYAIWSFERFKRSFAVSIATDYLSVLQRADEIRNAEDNYRRLVLAARRARHLADAGRLPEFQVDQARQDELRARSQWIAAMESYQRSLDNLKITIGLPTDAQVDLDPDELSRLAGTAQQRLGRVATQSRADEPVVSADDPVQLQPPDRDGGPYEIDETVAIRKAFANRLDLRVTQGEVYDAQRDVIVAADALQAGLSISAGGAVGNDPSAPAGLDAVNLRFDEGTYTFGADLDLPWERTAERNAYRVSFIAMEQAVRAVQELEDQVKLSIRNDLRQLQQQREDYRIQSMAVQLARRRVESVNLLLRAGRAEIRDLLEAQTALVDAQNALTAALVDYRVAELQLQLDMGVLEVNERGLWREYDPSQFN